MEACAGRGTFRPSDWDLGAKALWETSDVEHFQAPKIEKAPTAGVEKGLDWECSESRAEITGQSSRMPRRELALVLCLTLQMLRQRQRKLRRAQKVDSRTIRSTHLPAFPLINGHRA